MAHEQTTSSPFSAEALALAEETRHWIARHKILVVIGTTAVVLGLCSLSAAVVNTVTNEIILDIHEGPIPLTLYLGSYSSCQLRPDVFNGNVPVMRDNGGVTVGLIYGWPQFIEHSPEWRECTLPGGW